MDQLQKRNELKYPMSISNLKALLSKLEPFLTIDPYTNPLNHKYPVTSFYFDCYDLRFYHEKMDGEYYRRKLRVRQYEKDFSPLKPFSLEIKEKIGDHILKKRAQFSYEDLKYIWQSDMSDNQQNYSEKQKKLIEETRFLLHAMPLLPQVCIKYDRIAFSAKYSSKIRFTIDFDVKYAPIHRFPLTVQEYSKMYFRPLTSTDVIIEIKSNGDFPDWLISGIQSFNLKLSSISKYCMGVAAARQFNAT